MEKAKAPAGGQRYEGQQRRQNRERGRDGRQGLVAGAAWELGHRQECLCY